MTKVLIERRWMQAPLDEQTKRLKRKRAVERSNEDDGAETSALDERKNGKRKRATESTSDAEQLHP
eukprot:2082562-Amphidinium_carterae.1